MSKLACFDNIKNPALKAKFSVIKDTMSETEQKAMANTIIKDSYKDLHTKNNQLRKVSSLAEINYVEPVIEKIETDKFERDSEGNILVNDGLNSSFNDILTISDNDDFGFAKKDNKLYIIKNNLKVKEEVKKPQTLAEKKKALLNKSINNIKEVLVTPNTSNFTINDLKEITIDMEGQKYTLDLENGNISRLGISGKVKVNPDTPKYGKILLTMSESKPFSKTGGFVDGIFVQDIEVEKDGNNVMYKALGLPSLNMTEVFLDENGGVTSKEFTENLTENGKKQFENFENRYC